MPVEMRLLIDVQQAHSRSGWPQVASITRAAKPTAQAAVGRSLEEADQVIRCGLIGCSRACFGDNNS